jgi:hypothetical protein
MKGLHYSQQKHINIRKISGTLFVSLLALAFLGFLLKSLLKSIFPLIMPLVISAYAIVPGLFIFIVPWMSHAWLGGINPISYPIEPWKELTNWKKFTVYVNSLFLLAGSILLFVLVLLEFILET